MTSRQLLWRLIRYRPGLYLLSGLLASDPRAILRKINQAKAGDRAISTQPYDDPSRAIDDREHGREVNVHGNVRVTGSDLKCP